MTSAPKNATKTKKRGSKEAEMYASAFSGGDYSQEDYAKAYGISSASASVPKTKKRASKEAQMYAQAFSGGKKRRKKRTMKKRR